MALPAGQPPDKAFAPSGKTRSSSRDEAPPSRAAIKPKPAAAGTTAAGAAFPRAGKSGGNANQLAAQGPPREPASASRTKPGKAVSAAGPPQPPASTSKSQAAKDFAAASRYA